MIVLVARHPGSSMFFILFLNSDRSRETANLEYLKNIVLHYMEDDNLMSRLQIVKAIGTILQFSPKEVTR